MNIELLQKIKQHILEVPARFQMDVVLVQESPLYPNLFARNSMTRPWPECGTAGCYAGWAVALSGGKASDFSKLERARALLNLDSEQASRLFYGTPEGYRGIWNGDGSRETAELAAKRIDLFISTDGKE